MTRGLLGWLGCWEFEGVWGVGVGVGCRSGRCGGGVDVEGVAEVVLEA